VGEECFHVGHAQKPITIWPWRERARVELTEQEARANFRLFLSYIKYGSDRGLTGPG
jgi:hypothetical protein